MSPFLPPPDALLDPAVEHAANVVLLILLLAASFALGWMLCADWPVASRVWQEIGRYIRTKSGYHFKQYFRQRNKSDRPS